MVLLSTVRTVLISVGLLVLIAIWIIGLALDGCRISSFCLVSWVLVVLCVVIMVGDLSGPVLCVTCMPWARRARCA